MTPITPMTTIPRIMMSARANCRPWRIMYPSPALAASISAATSVAHAFPRATRMPAKVMVMADGIPILRNTVKLVAPQVLATLISTGLDCLMPVYALITQGTKAEKNTINALACRPIPIQMMVSGIQETGGMGRRISKMGRNENNKTYPAELALFAVSSSCRGKGIGKMLFQSALNYMKQEKLKEFYLFTDTSCNYGFYEHQGMKRRLEKKHVFNIKGQQAVMNFFIYDYQLSN